MNDEAESQRTRGLRLIWPTIVIAAMAVLGYMLYRPEFESDRPAGGNAALPQPPSARGMKAVFSRLWEDPLQPAAGASSAAKTADRDAAPPSVQEVITRLAGIPSQRERDLANVQRVMKYLASSSQSGKLHVVPVLVPGGPYADDREQRMRTRYAVLSSLGASGYRLALPERMTSVEIPVSSYLGALNECANHRLQVPVKLYSRDDVSREDTGPRGGRFERVLILWINETQLGDRPLNVLGQILSRLFKEDKIQRQVKVSIVGPTKSDTLLAMARERPLGAADKPVNADLSDLKEAYRALNERFVDVTLYCPRATISPQDLNSAQSDALRGFTDPQEKEKEPTEDAHSKEDSTKDASAEEDSAKDAPSKENSTKNSSAEEDSAKDAPSEQKQTAVNGTAEPKLAIPCLKVVRTVGTDHELVDALQNELSIRDALPRSEHDSRHVVIITERDTLYGRGLRSAFRFHDETSTSPSSGIHSSRLHFFTYLRGLDGELLQREAKHEDGQLGSTPRRPDQRPEGPAQYDYLQRLVGQVQQLQDRLAGEGEGEITAIGVMGTDVYDKLLVLRALRRSFPRAWFFTTDLDAALVLRDESEHTRNMLVASHFGLELHPSLQRDVPVFRDSYQTSLFHAMLLILRDNVVEAVYGGAAEAARSDPWRTKTASRTLPVDNYLQPLVFEISRYGPYQLTSTGGPQSQGEWLEAVGDDKKKAKLSALVHPVSPREVAVRRAPERWLLTFFALLLLWMTVAMLHGRARRATARFLRAFARVAHPRRSKLLDWAIVLPVVVTVLFVVALFFDANIIDAGEPFELTAGISVWPTSLIRLGAGALAVFFVLKGYHDTRSSERRLAEQFYLDTPTRAQSAGRLLVRACGAWRQCGVWGWYCALWGQLRTDRMAPTRNIQPQWRNYAHRSFWLTRIVRAAPAALMFYVAAWLVLSLWGSPFLPARGWFSTTSAQFILHAAVVAMLVLLFFVLDGIQLCRGFVDWLNDGVSHWPTAAKQGLHRGEEYPQEVARELLNVRFTAQFTHVVGKLVIYPFLVLFLLIVSRLRLFDNWDIPWPLLGIFTVMLGSIVWASLSLRNTTDKGRRNVLERLRDHRAALTGRKLTEAKRRTLAEQYELAIAEIEQERRGAFRPLLEDPIIRALAIPFGGIGGAVLIEQVASLMN
jgi:hypothetical protein